MCQRSSLWTESLILTPRGGNYSDKCWGVRPAQPQDTLLIARAAPQPFDLTSKQWESTGKLPPNAERLVTPRANFNPTLEVGGGAPVPVQTWQSMALHHHGLLACSQAAQRG